MELKELLTDDGAVSPVIGVILMVAITVILAAVIATFVLGLGEQVSSTAPQASFTFEFEEIEANGGGGVLSITHDGGDSIKSQELIIRGQNGSNGLGNSGNYNVEWQFIKDNEGTIGGTTNGVPYGSLGGSSNVAASVSGETGGESAVVSGDFIEFPISSDGEIRTIYEATRGDTSATLGTWEGPDA